MTSPFGLSDAFMRRYRRERAAQGAINASQARTRLAGDDPEAPRPFFRPTWGPRRNTADEYCQVLDGEDVDTHFFAGSYAPPAEWEWPLWAIYCAAGGDRYESIKSFHDARKRYRDAIEEYYGAFYPLTEGEGQLRWWRDAVPGMVMGALGGITGGTALAAIGAISGGVGSAVSSGRANVAAMDDAISDIIASKPAAPQIWDSWTINAKSRFVELLRNMLNLTQPQAGIILSYMNA